jgi:hypothetical protein
MRSAGPLRLVRESANRDSQDLGHYGWQYCQIVLLDLTFLKMTRVTINQINIRQILEEFYIPEKY